MTTIIAFATLVLRRDRDRLLGRGGGHVVTLPFVSMDAAALRSSEYREIRNVIRDLKPDCRKPTEALLLGLGYPEEIVDEALYDHAEEEYAKLTAREQEEAGYRYWLDETPGRRREVA